MSEWQLFTEGTVPEFATADWYADRDAAPHLEQDGHRERLLLTRDLCLDAAERGASSVVDLGAGDGGLLSLLAPHFDPAFGYDLQPANVAAARERGVDVSLANVTTAALPLADLYVATELLEHLIDPHDLVARIPGRFLVTSSPYTENAVDHYEFHCWAWDLNGYAEMLAAAGWRVLRHETAWICQVVLCERASR